VCARRAAAGLRRRLLGHPAAGEKAWSAAAGAFVFLPRGVPHGYDVIHGSARKLIIAVPGGIEDFFDDLVNGVDPATVTHRHGVRFLD